MIMNQASMNETVLLTGHSRGLGSFILSELQTDYNVIGVSSKELDLKNPRLVSEYKTDGVTHLICNAAVAYDDLISNLSVFALTEMMNVNVVSAMLLTRQVIRDMLLHDAVGSITFISSISAHVGFKGLSMYGATKAAMEAFSRGVAREWGSKGIRSNSIACGYMDTDMSRAIHEDDRGRIINRTELKRLLDPKDVARMVRHCIENNSLTGQTLKI